MRLFLILALSLAGAPAWAQTVRIPVTVMDRNEQFVRNLTAGDFRILEDGVEQKVQSASISADPLSLGILFDKSRSMARPVAAADDDLLAGLATALGTSAAEDEFFLISFANQVEMSCDFTHSPLAIIRAYNRTELGGGTALWDALYQAATHMAEAANPRKALLLITDGDDNRSRKSQEEVKEALRRSGSPLFVLYVSFAGPGGIYHARTRPTETLAVESGGWYKEITDKSRIAPFILATRDFLRAQYLITYASTHPADGKWRKVRVKVVPNDTRKLKAIAPEGYLAR